ncbi:MAG: V-type ATP synthase subunit I [Hominisplanchenecus sp.]
MIEKMKFLSITGPKEDIDHVVNDYLSKYEIHLENALSELKTVKSLRPFIEINPYKDKLAKAEEFVTLLGNPTDTPSGSISIEEASELLDTLGTKFSDVRAQTASLEEKREQRKASYERLKPFLGFNFDIHSVLQFKFIKYRFGRIAHDYYKKLEHYVYENLDTVFYRCSADDQYVWGIYFVPANHAFKIDAVFSSLHFERIHLPDEYEGIPQEVGSKLQSDIHSLTRQIEDCQKEGAKILAEYRDKILLARDKFKSLSSNFDVRKLAACTKEEKQSFYILCGWMTEKDSDLFIKDIANDKNVYCIIEDNDEQTNSELMPPTKLKNPRLFRPFEMFVRMYGLPAYNELDPTIFVALTYSFIFGAMFGDVGQGLCLVIGGALLYKFKKMELAACISCAGIFSTIFGFLFGSFFGFEDVIPALWMHPKTAMTTLPFIGSMNTAFVVAIAFGMFLILTTMILHIVNAVRSKNIGNLIFDTNGIAGIVFYGAIVAVVFLFMTGHTLPAAGVLIVMFVVPLILIGFKEPLTKLVEKKADAMPKEKAMFLVTAFFELFEVLLSYFSNTLSFVRIGAFAVSHAAMMEVVLMLAGAESGSPNWIVIVLGNVFVCAMEGLIVGIQVLRLEYYEMFSRFYKGDGHPFKPFIKKSV